jgi:glycosyltransferase involved in cell wall biosynthesis
VTKLRVVQFADFVNKYDFIDTIIRYADPARFLVGVCVRTTESNILPPRYTAEVPHWVLTGTSRWSIPKTAWRLAGLLRRWRADVLHTHHYDQAFIGWLATRIYPKTRLVVGRHYSDAIYRLHSAWKKRALIGVEQVVNRAASRIVVPSVVIRAILTDRQGVDPSKVDVIPYGFAPEKYPSLTPDEVRRIREGLAPAGRFVVGTVCRLHEEKGVGHLVRAASLLRDCVPHLTFVVVGDGPERPALERQITEAGLGETVRLIGWRRDAVTVIGAVDAVVQPTLQEAFSQVMIEALWMGKPLVTTDVSGAVDVIRDGENGLLVPKGDPVALAAAVERLVYDGDFRARLGARGQADVRERLNITKVVRQYENLYDHAVRDRVGCPEGRSLEGDSCG